MPNGVHGDERPGLEMDSRHIYDSQQLLPDVTRQDCLRLELHHAGRSKSPDSKKSAEVEILGEDDLPVAVGVFEDHAVGTVRLANVDPVDGLVTCGCEEVDPPRAEVHVDEEPHAEIGISISSTRQAAYARACITSCSSRYG